MKKLQVTIEGEEAALILDRQPGEVLYRLEGALTESGKASVVEVEPGVFSVLVNHRSYAAYILKQGDELAVWIDGRRHSIAISDVRDRSARGAKQAAAGPLELRAQMPGKVIKLLVETGSSVRAGESLIVVEAMKMQNEIKSPKDGVIAKIYAPEGATVAAGERLLMVK